MNLTLLHYYKYLFTIVILGSLGFFTSCVDNQYPDDIWDPNLGPKSDHPWRALEGP